MVVGTGEGGSPQKGGRRTGSSREGVQTGWGRMERAVMFEFISLFKRQAVEYGVNFFPILIAGSNNAQRSLFCLSIGNCLARPRVPCTSK